MSLAVLALLLAAILSLSPVRQARAAFPGRNGKIAFEGQRLADIWTMNPDGTHRRHLVGGGESDQAYEPAFSPNGRKIAFQSNLGAGFRLRIWTINADGTHRRVIPGQSAFCSADPAFSPSGKKIAFIRGCPSDSDVYKVNADGTNPLPLTSGPANDVGPVFSPRGHKIAFTRISGSGNDIYVVRTDGTHLHRLISNAYGPAFSPNGRKIVFNRGNDIYVVRTDGTHARRLTRTGCNSSPVFSPNGRKIAFFRPCFAGDIYKMDADGTRLHRLTKDSNNRVPDWGVRP